jgi:chromate transport protein ChrA
MDATPSNYVGFSFRRFAGLLSRALEALILPACVINLLWVFFFHHYTRAEIVFQGCIVLLLALFLLVQLARLFVDWRTTLFGLGRGLIYALLTSFMYL